MNQVRLVSRVPVLLAAALLGAQAQTQITSPEKFFGFQLGSDRKMARWDKIVEYYNLLEKEAGGRLKVVNTGTNLTYWYSWTGIKWNQLYSVAIASGYLSTGGRGGYLYLFVGGGEGSTNYYDELVESWVQGTN